MAYIAAADGKIRDCIGLGRLCIDLNANEINRPLEETRTFTKYVGGSPANIAIALARLGATTGFIGKVADDAFGRFIVRYLQDEGIDASQVATDRTGAVTGLAFTEIKSPSECSILMYRDNVADLKLASDEVDESYIRESRSLLVSGTALARSPSREAAFRAIELAHRHGTTVMLDIDYRPYSWGSRDEVYAYCRMAAERSDIIFGGREEFDLLESAAERQSRQGDDRATAASWLERRARLVVIKHGGEGSVAYAEGGASFACGVYPAQVIKTFGAGDSFAGAFIYGLLREWPIDRCLQYGSAAASIVVASHSCSDAMPDIRRIEEVIGRLH